jgi:catechol 2,3-dioxygenase-like lactoylglutathione lyase family enzyme
MSEFPGVSHVVITVTDLGVSRPWYRNLFGVDPVIDEDTGSFHHTVFPLPGGVLISLHEFKPDLAHKGPADEFHPGLDHIAFGVANRGELETWAKRLDELGIGHGKIIDESYGSGLAFRDPDNIQLEFFAPPG